jgi:uncharacterized DUF497 family protein
MHKTNAGEKRKGLLRDARVLAREAKGLQKVRRMEPAAKIRQDESDRLKAEANALKHEARLEDLQVWVMEKTKTTRKGSRSYRYWMATWREYGKTRNVHLGSARKMSQNEARQKARAMKAEALAIKL